MKISIKSNFDLGKLDMWKINQIGLENASQNIERLAQANAPYATGRLKSLIGVDPQHITRNTKSVRIGPRGVVYAVPREFVNFKNPTKKFYMRRTHRYAAKIVEVAFGGAVQIVANNISK